MNISLSIPLFLLLRYLLRIHFLSRIGFLTRITSKHATVSCLGLRFTQDWRSCNYLGYLSAFSYSTNYILQHKVLRHQIGDQAMISPFHFHKAGQCTNPFSFLSYNHLQLTKPDSYNKNVASYQIPANIRQVRAGNLVCLMIGYNPPNNSGCCDVQRTVQNFEDAHTNRDSIWIAFPL